MNPTRSPYLAAKLSVLLVLFVPAFLHAAPQNSPVISFDPDGHLTYATDERGNRVPDFSHCGYAGGDRPIPIAPVRVVVEPKPGDSSARIQQAIDYIASLPLDANGFRGAVLLLKGKHEVLGSLRITGSGVVLRGQGTGDAGTELVAAGQDRRTLIRIAGRDDRITRTKSAWQVADDYVPVGAVSFRLKDARELKPGSTILLIRPSTQDWIDRLGATEFGGGIGGGWKPGTRDLAWDRVITSIEGNRVTVDAPITTAIEIPVSGRTRRNEAQTEKESETPYVVSYAWSGRITNAGVENLRLESSFDAGNPKDENHSWCAITIENAADVWVRQVTFKHFAASAVALYETCKRVTVQDCLSLAPVSEIGGYRRHTFFTMGQQTLFLRCFAEHGRHDFSVGHCAAGPNAFVQCEAREALDESGPIESWASGVLYDNVTIDGNALTLGFRPGNNAGIGWAAANCVLWNCSASVIRCWNPPGAQNWSFGSWAGFEGDGTWRSSNDFVSPDNLFAGQVKDRLGAEAGARLKLMPRPHEESSNPPLDKAQQLAAASHQPAARLLDYIVAASERDPISSELSEARRVEEISLAPGFSQVTKRTQDTSTASAVSRPPEAVETASSSSRFSNTGLKPGANEQKLLLITNGWLTCDGKLLIGGSAIVAWWRGNIRPDEAASFGFGVTRFVPGRLGPGFTDDLDEVADSLLSKGKAALDHNYGLWYDRRRDDHERVRRMTGDVLPPFYEQPFARVGSRDAPSQNVAATPSSRASKSAPPGDEASPPPTAWDGLSQYDLTQFNPWYWSRLKAFAELCDDRGLVLFHQNYFQHNILEAGAHWADSPWRSANNINHTGFPEPPPYAGDKRIFQAELFYDVTHPARLKLHENYIRQCLSNFTNNANVIQFTSAEFTGPLHFMQFWLDTIAEWERRTGVAPVSNQSESSAQAEQRNGDRRDARPTSKPIIALSATKDVQDAILADVRRSAIVDVIDFRYWWRTDKGEFAPPGGKNLAPRQFERQWRGGRPNDENLAEMAAEYRTKFPAKPLICDFDAAGWAWVCAGGSMPRLPKTTDAKLLAAIPLMHPRSEMSKDGRWALIEAGKQMLVYLDGRTEFDLSNESGSFRANVVNIQTGEVTPGEIMKAGSKVKLPSTTVVWLTKED